MTVESFPRRPARHAPTARPRSTNGAAELAPWTPTDADAPGAAEWHPDIDAIADAIEDAELGPAAWRTLADISDDPPGELLLGMLEPDGPNLLYALGGVGKGSTGAWMCGELLALGIRPMIYDVEGRPKEWARRVSGLGIDRREVVYLAPSDLPPTLLGKPMWEIAPHLGEIAHKAAAGLLFIDSILPATGLGEDRLKSDPQVPYLYVQALDALGIPSVSFGHPPKGQPEGEPFGSVGWVNAMRLTWNGTAAEGDGHRVRWRPRKRNERGHIPGVLLTFSYGDDGRLAGVTRENDEESTRDWLLLALKDGSRKVSELAEELIEQLDEHVTDDQRKRLQERIARSLYRMVRDGAAVKEGGRGGSGVRYGLKWSA